jgi:hypothetical protein
MTPRSNKFIFMKSIIRSIPPHILILLALAMLATSTLAQAVSGAIGSTCRLLVVRGRNGRFCLAWIPCKGILLSDVLRPLAPFNVGTQSGALVPVYSGNRLALHGSQ